MTRILLSVAVVLLTAAAAVANPAPPPDIPKPPEPGVTVAAIVGGAGAVLAGFWFIRRPKP